MKILASWDDASAQDIEIARLMKQYNIPSIFYWPVYPELVNEPSGRNSLTEEEMMEISKDFEIGSHTLTHPLLTRVDKDQAENEIKVSRQYLQKKFQQSIDSFCYPRGYSSPEIQTMVVEAGYTNARGVTVGYIHESENPFYTQTTVHVGCNRKEYGGKTWLEYARKMLDQAIKEPNSIYRLWGHSWEVDKNEAWQDLEVLLKELHDTHSKV